MSGRAGLVAALVLVLAASFGLASHHHGSARADGGALQLHDVVYQLPGDETYSYREVHVLVEGGAPDDSFAMAEPFVTIGARWKYPRMDWAYNADNAPFGDVSFATAGAAAWTDVGGSGFLFTYTGTTTALPDCKEPVSEWKPDGHNTVGWGPLPDRVLGITCVGGRAKLPDGNVEIAEADIVFSSTANMTAEVASLVAMHEFGHALGMDHTEAAKCPGPVMCAELTAQTSHTLTADDIAGAQQIYALFRNRRTVVAVGRD